MEGASVPRPPCVGLVICISASCRGSTQEALILEAVRRLQSRVLHITTSRVMAARTCNRSSSGNGGKEGGAHTEQKGWLSINGKAKAIERTWTPMKILRSQ
jgi:hypothetical protein